MENTTPTNLKPNDPKQPLREEGEVFFNVMPKVSIVNDVLVEPKIKSQPTPANDLPEAKNNPVKTLKKHKFFFIMGLLVLIGAPVGYFLIPKLLGNPYEEEEFVITGSSRALEDSSNNADIEEEFSTPQEWRDKYFPECQDITSCGDNADPDRDGLLNLEEHTLNSDPNNPDSDQDGLADGDEAHVFGSDPINSHSANNQKYSDLDFIKGGYDLNSDKPMTPEQIAAITEKMNTYKLHQATIVSLGEILNSLYKFAAPSPTTTPPSATSSLPSDLDLSLEAQQDRDVRRSNAIKNVEIALVKFEADNQTYPSANDFASMFLMVKPYLRVATNPLDPINKDPYIYIYKADIDGADFTLTFYSEIAKQTIKKTAQDAQKDAQSQEAQIYDNQRQTDLDSLRLALLLYSQQKVDGNQNYAFPPEDEYKTAIVPDYISEIPKDPKTGNDYEYKVSETFDTFTLRTPLDNPPSGTTGWLCNQEECRAY